MTFGVFLSIEHVFQKASAKIFLYPRSDLDRQEKFPYSLAV